MGVTRSNDEKPRKQNGVCLRQLSWCGFVTRYIHMVIMLKIILVYRTKLGVRDLMK